MSSLPSLSRHSALPAWRPHVVEALDRHGLRPSRGEPFPGRNATYPTFVWGDVVLKLFGGSPAWRTAFEAERTTLSALGSSEVRAPQLLAWGWLERASWPYLVMARLPGVPLQEARLTRAQREGVAAEVGQQLARVHALPTAGLSRPSAWPAHDVAAAAARSSLPPHLVAQVDGFLAGLPEAGPPTFVHGDLTQTHAFVSGGRLSGIIDWGDALATDPHYELIQVARALLGCERDLLRVFLEAAGWVRGPDFARQALGWGLRRQALGLVQHHGMDVFEPLAARYPLDELATLDQLAELVFDV